MHQRRALALQLKGQLVDVITAMKEQPECILDLRQLLVHKGLLNALGPNGKPIMQGAHQERLPINDQTNGDDQGSDAEDAKSLPAGMTDGASTMSLSGTYIRLYGDHGLSAKWFKYLLAQLEPVALSPFAIKALVPKGRREVSVRTCMELVEFCTDLDEATNLTGELRDAKVLVSEMQRLSLASGRLGQHLTLPPDWSTAGWYSITRSGSESLEVRKLLEAKVGVLTRASLDIDEAAFDSLGLQRGYSKRRAELVASSGKVRVLLATLF